MHTSYPSPELFLRDMSDEKHQNDAGSNGGSQRVIVGEMVEGKSLHLSMQAQTLVGTPREGPPTPGGMTETVKPSGSAPGDSARPSTQDASPTE